MPGRGYSSGAYRYGFNGKENDNEVKGTGNQLDFGERIYDPRTGRFLSIDPMMQSYPVLSCYNYAANNPIVFIEKDGKYFDLNGLSKQQQAEFRTEIKKATKNDPYLKAIYTALAKDKNLKISIKLNSNIHVGGMYKPTGTNTGDITYKSLSSIYGDRAATNEEMFHAYQHKFMGIQNLSKS